MHILAIFEDTRHIVTTASQFHQRVLNKSCTTCSVSSRCVCVCIGHDGVQMVLPVGSQKKNVFTTWALPGRTLFGLSCEVFIRNHLAFYVVLWRREKDEVFLWVLVNIFQ